MGRGAVWVGLCALLVAGCSPSAACSGDLDQICRDVDHCVCGDPCGTGGDCSPGQICDHFASKPGGVCVDPNFSVAPGSSEMSSQAPLRYQPDSACHQRVRVCFRDCEAQILDIGGVGVDRCEHECAATYKCFPFDRAPAGPPCRVSGSTYECNFALCFDAANSCNLDCFNAFVTETPSWLAECNQQCYAYFGCLPHDHDPCNPLPPGYVYCACPSLHGTECHPPGPSCP